MLALQITAIVLLTLSVLLFIGPQIIMYGPRAIPALARKKEVHFIGTCFASLAVLAVIAPTLGTALSTGGATIYAMAVELSNMSFGLI